MITRTKIITPYGGRASLKQNPTHEEVNEPK